MTAVRATRVDGAAKQVLPRQHVIRWDAVKKPQALEEALWTYVRPGMSVESIRAFAAAQNMEVSSLRGNTVYASHPAPSAGPFVKAKWLVQFRFNDAQELDDLSVREGLIGP